MKNKLFCHQTHLLQHFSVKLYHFFRTIAFIIIKLFSLQVLNAAQVSGEEYDSMRDLLLPMGRSPDLS